MNTFSPLSVLYFSILVLMSWLGFSTPLQTQTDFYKGKTITFVVGVSPGGAYDVWARLISSHMSKHIPGNPNIIVQNMPGAGGLVAANYVYHVAKPDGLTTVMPANRLYIDQFVGRSEVKFDVRKFIWIGNPQRYYTVIYMRADAPYTSITDIIDAKAPPKCGASEIDLAVERGEVVCRGHDIINHFSGATYRGWHERSFDRHIVQDSPKRDPRLPDTPTIFELMDKYKTPQLGRRTAEFISASAEFGRPMMTTPGTPADRVKILREAYAKTMKDPGFVAQADKSQLILQPSSGEELQALAKRIMDQPPEVVQKVKKILNE